MFKTILSAQPPVNTIGKLYINRPAYINNSNYPLTSSSWTASEIWNNGTPYKPTTTTIAIAYDKVGIGMTPSQSSEYKLEVNGDVKCSNLQCISVSQTSDLRFKKNIENIDNILKLIDINYDNIISTTISIYFNLNDKKFKFLLEYIITNYSNLKEKNILYIVKCLDSQGILIRKKDMLSYNKYNNQDYIGYINIYNVESKRMF